jgi:hypothetical protein
MTKAIKILDWVFPWAGNMFRVRPNPRPRLTEEERQSRFRENGKAIILVSVVLLLWFAWTRDTFDNFLWRVHLNHSTCIQNGFGAVFCGDAAKNYNKRLRDAGLGG